MTTNEAGTKNKTGDGRANGEFTLPAPADPEFLNALGETLMPESHR